MNYKNAVPFYLALCVWFGFLTVVSNAFAQAYPYYTRSGNNAGVGEEYNIYQRTAGYPTHAERQEKIKKEEVQREIVRARQAPREQEISILTRKQSEYDPLNVRVGDFIVSPSLTVTGTYIDNVYLTENNTLDDYILATRGEVGIRSDFSHHALEAQFAFEDGRFQDNDSEDYQDYLVGFGGRYDVTNYIRVPVSFRFQRDHTKRDSPDDTDGVEPTVFDTQKFMTGVDYTGYAIKASYRTEYADINYDNNRDNVNVVINNQDRNRSEWKNNITLGLADVMPFSPFAYAGLVAVDYDSAIDDFGVNKDSFGWNAGVGALIALSGVTNSSIKIGAVQRDFDDVTLDDITDVEIAADITWEPSPLLALTLGAQRYMDETSLQNTSASMNSRVGLKAVYELMPNIYLTPDIAYLLRDYESSNNRTIDQVSGGLSATYKLNRSIWSSLSYRYINQTEEIDTAPTTDASSNAVMLSIKLQM